MSFMKHEKALVDPQAQVGDQTRIWAFANIQAGARIGQSCNIADGCFVEKGAVIGNHVTLKNHVCVWDGVTLEDDVFVGASTAFINDRLPRSHRKDQWVLERTVVKKGATIGANATILCGVTIGAYAFVAAGAVVTKSVGDYELVVGNPAKYVGYVCQCGRRLNHQHACGCGKQYNIINQQLILQV